MKAFEANAQFSAQQTTEERISNSVQFLGLFENDNRDWEKDCSLDTYGLNDNQESFCFAL